MLAISHRLCFEPVDWVQTHFWRRGVPAPFPTKRVKRVEGIGFLSTLLDTVSDVNSREMKSQAHQRASLVDGHTYCQLDLDDTPMEDSNLDSTQPHQIRMRMELDSPASIRKRQGFTTHINNMVVGG